MPARLEAEPGPDPVEPRDEILPPLGHGRAPEQRRAACNQANRVAGGVTVDAEEGVTHRRPPLVRRPERYRAPAGSPRPFRSEEHTSELQSLMRSSYAVFCLKKNRK